MTILGPHIRLRAIPLRWQRKDFIALPFFFQPLSSFNQERENSNIDKRVEAKV
jgi:hypothetical protein